MGLVAEGDRSEGKEVFYGCAIIGNNRWEIKMIW